MRKSLLTSILIWKYFKLHKKRYSFLKEGIYIFENIYMDIKISQNDREKIEAGIREKYAQVAKSPEGQFRYPTGKNGLEALGYDKILVDALPTAVASSYCGVGNPFSLGKIKPGEQILDIGCGAGVDTILAAILAGGKGSAIGVDIVTEMIERAECNLALMDLENVKFQKASGESLSFAEDTFDVVISNGVIKRITMLTTRCFLMF